MKTMSDSAALVMNHKILAIRSRPNQPFSWELAIHDDISGFPILPRLCKPPVVVDTKCDHGWRQIGGGVHFMEARGILQCLAILCRKPRDIRIAESLDRYDKKHAEANTNHAHSVA